MRRRDSLALYISHNTIWVLFFNNQLSARAAQLAPSRYVFSVQRYQNSSCCSEDKSWSGGSKSIWEPPLVNHGSASLPPLHVPYCSWSCPAVFRIHDILVWIRIRGSMPLTNGFGFGCGSESFYFHHWPSRCQQKTIFFFKVDPDSDPEHCCPAHPSLPPSGFSGTRIDCLSRSFIDTVYRIKEFSLDWQTLNEAATVDTEHCFKGSG